VAYVSNAADHTVPPPDAAFLQQLEDGIVAAGEAAVKSRRRGGDRFADCRWFLRGRQPAPSRGSEHSRSARVACAPGGSTALIGVMLIVSMHPTVLHEDSTLYSGDFPGLTRQRLQAAWQGLPVIYHTGACGNQSPRHVVKANTFAEAERLGYALADNVLEALATPKFSAELTLGHGATSDRLPLRVFPGEAEAAAAVDTATARFERLKQTNPGSPETRTAETDLFGAQETLTLAQAVRRGLVDAAAAKCMPAEVQCFRLGDQRIAAFPGEVFVEFVLDLQAEFPKLHAITMANGELQGYLVTEEALGRRLRGSNALFKSPDGANILMDLAAELLCDPALEVG
jgi:neutral ceramidase